MIPKKLMVAFTLVILAVAFLAVLPSTQAASTGTIVAQSTAVQGFCGGSPTGVGSVAPGSGGVIPTTNILSGQTNGEQSILNLSVLIMLVMLMVVAVIYMVSYIFNLDMLKNMVKAEIGEIFITAIIVAIFIGSFSVLSSATTTQTGFAVAGSSFGRGTFVDDCAYLSTASINLVVPFFAINIVRFVVATVDSVSIQIEPTYFGFSDKPLSGYKLFDTVLGYIDAIAGAFILLILGTLTMLSIIYAIFPIFLYAGIVLRTLPWTRAAGGALLGLFAGFYILFPLLLHVMLAGYIGTITSVSATTQGQQSLSILGTITSTVPNANGVGTLLTLLWNTITGMFSMIGTTVTNGIIGGFITGVIEPALFTTLSILMAFLISFDFTEAMGDILGAPSLSTKNMFGKLL